MERKQSAPPPKTTSRKKKKNHLAARRTTLLRSVPEKKDLLKLSFDPARTDLGGGIKRFSAGGLFRLTAGNWGKGSSSCLSGLGKGEGLT